MYTVHVLLDTCIIYIYLTKQCFRLTENVHFNSIAQSDFERVVTYKVFVCVFMTTICLFL